MKYALSTNWCNRRLETGEAIADLALELGFDELELGFHTSQAEVAGYRRRLDQIRIGSVHAFAPVPISAPCGYPELYLLASEDDEARKMALFQVKRNVAFASDIGAETVVLHAGRVALDNWWCDLGTLRLNDVLRAAKNDIAAPSYRKLLDKARTRRAKRGAKRLESFKRTLDELMPTLSEKGVTLALENLPYLEGFPNAEELASLLDELKDAPVKGWFDTGHDRVQRCHGWCADTPYAALEASRYRGMHLNDVVNFNDDHLPPGEGQVDFAALAPFARQMHHLVFEPNSAVSEEALRKGLKHIRSLWDA